MSRAKKNNYDKSSTGTDIECSCFYDTDLSQHNFSENIEVLQHNGYRTTSIGYYIDNGNLPSADTVKMTIRASNSELVAAARKYTSAYSDLVAISGDDIEEVKAEILSQFEDVNLVNFALGKLPEVDGLEFVPNKNLIVLETRGYCQGDYAKVIYCPDDCLTVWGNMPEQSAIQKMVDHYYWDSPIFAKFTIDGKEYDYQEMSSYDEYEWNRDAFIEYVAKESGIDKENLGEFVPQYPEYA